jgi:signal transduction histidine kinase
MRASFVVMLSKASAFCSLALSASIAFAQKDSINQVSAEVLPLITNLVQLREVSSSEPSALYDVRLEGDVWWASAAQRKLVFKDTSGAEELELELNGAWPHAGKRVRLQGHGTVVQKGAGFRVGPRNPVVDNNGAQKSFGKSGTTYLLAGRYPFRLEWFNSADKPGLDVSCETRASPRQRLSGAMLWRPEPMPDGASTNFVQGLNYQCYEGEWETLPDFNSLTPVKTGTCSGPDGKLRTRPNNSGLVFTGFFEAATRGLYTFYLKSSDGSRLFVGEPTLRTEILGPAAFPPARPLRLGQDLEETENGCWSEMEGQVTSIHQFPDGIRLELRNGARTVLAQIGEPSGFPFPQLLKCWIRAKGFAEAAFTPDGQRVVGCLLVPGSKEIVRLDVPIEAGITNQIDANGAVEIPRIGDKEPVSSLPVLTTAGAVRELRPGEARRGYPFKLRGVVTCVQADNRSFVVQDATVGLYLTNAPALRKDLPELGEFVEVEGLTADSGIALAQTVRHLGAGKLPEPIHPTWGQLLNGSLDSQWIEISGLVEGITNRPNSWSRLSLHTASGILKVDLRRPGVMPGPLQQYDNSVIHLRGCMFADWHADTLRLKVGQIRMYDAEVTMDQPNPADLFAQPSETVAALMRFDPAFHTAQRVKVAGQVVFIRDAYYFMMDGCDGLRFAAKEPLGLQVGDLVEVVGFPELSGAAPVLRGAVARKTGHRALPEPQSVASADLSNLAHDSTRVRVQGILDSLKQTVDSQVLEIQAGTRRFLARLYDHKISLKNLRVGSRLELVGVYCAQGGYSALGTDVVPLDLLLGSPPEIRVLAPPPWWTLQRLLVLVGTLACLLALMVLWVTQLRSQVEQRSADLAVQIQTRERAEQQRAMEQERARIAQDLHDELGSDITEIGMLAARAKSISSTDQERTGYLGQMTQKARQMVDALEEIVWAMNPTHDSLESLVSYFRFFAERFLGLANISWLFDEIPAAQRYSVDSRRRHELFLAFKEALTNIVRHSGATRVRLSLEVEGAELRLTIADDGRGFSAAEHDKGMDGISNMRARIEKLGGRFELQSKQGQGTTLRFFVPLT